MVTRTQQCVLAAAAALATALVPLYLFAQRAPNAPPSPPYAPPASGGHPPPSVGAARCVPQRAQAFLIRDAYVARGTESAEQRTRRHAAHERAIRYRTEHYGYFAGFGQPAWNAHPPAHYAQSVTFMGLSVRVNRRVVPALACVEQELQRACTAAPYHPRALAGIRMENTYHTGEITNHAYGIAVDVDPQRNTCCGCVGAWGQHPLCHRPARAIWDRMAMPECWVHAFERYGFYWLGHDPMQDTMHFEFLGDPDAILR